MSSARSDRGAGNDADAGSRDPRNLLVVPIVKVANALRPRVIVVENVVAFLSRKVRHPESGEPVSAAELLVSSLAKEYAAYASIVDLADFGVPQHRRRCFLTLVRREERGLAKLYAARRAPFPRPTHGSAKRPHRSLASALQNADLATLDARLPETASDPKRALHAVPVWSERHYAMVSAIAANSGASAWENGCITCGREAADEDVRCESCGMLLPRPLVKDKDGAWRLIHGFRSSSYRRMHPERPASTVTTASGHIGSDSTLHPWENRVLSPLECADLQSFPRSFEWGEAPQRFGAGFLREVIGEAVPPRFTHQHGRILRKVLAGKVDQTYLRVTDVRCDRAGSKLSTPTNVTDEGEVAL
jgi:DNA (cytosine-5)-methyltransferase 1